MRALRIAAMLFAVLAVVALTTPLRHRLWKAELPVLGEVTAFHLISDAGKTFDSTSRAGAPWLAGFRDTG